MHRVWMARASLLACWCSLLAPVRGHLVARRAIVTAGAASLIALPPHRWVAHALDVDAAVPVALEGAKCKASSCQYKVLDDLGTLLDTKSIPRNAKGTSAMRLPSSVSGKRLQGLKEGTPTRIKMKITFADNNLGTADNYVQMLWMAERDSGRVLSARAFAAPPTEDPPRLAFDNRYADDELARIQDTPLVIRAYWSADGLWELPPFSFSDLLKGEKGESVQLVF